MSFASSSVRKSSVFKAIVLVALMACVGACDASIPSETELGSDEIEKELVTGVFAPRGQPTIEEVYNIELDLPLSEESFLQLTESLGLEFGGQGPLDIEIQNREAASRRPQRPLVIRNFDMDQVSHSYRLYGGLNGNINEIYLALVGFDRRVVYVESQYSAASPLATFPSR